MSASATSHLPNAGAAPRKALNVTLSIVRALLALTFFAAGGSKLVGRPDMVALFEAIGIGAITANVILHTTIIPPLALLLLSSFVVWGRRGELARLLGR